MRNKLRITTLMFEVGVNKEVLLPGFLGNTIRGALGKALVSLHCHESNKADCGNCSHTPTCIYATLFKSVYKDEEFASVPNPFVIEVGEGNRREYHRGDRFTFAILLFGKAIESGSAIMDAVNAMFLGSFGRTFGCLELLRIYNGHEEALLFERGKQLSLPRSAVWSDKGASSLEPILEIKVEFLSPTQILHKKKLVTSFPFDTFMDNVFSRVASIIDLYEEDEFILPYRLLFRKPKVTVEQSLQKKIIKQEKGAIEGMMGTVRYSGELTRFMPYIDLGCLLHVGKLTTRGFGQYQFTIL